MRLSSIITALRKSSSHDIGKNNPDRAQKTSSGVETFLRVQGVPGCYSSQERVIKSCKNKQLWKSEEDPFWVFNIVLFSASVNGNLLGPRKEIQKTRRNSPHFPHGTRSGGWLTTLENLNYGTLGMVLRRVFCQWWEIISPRLNSSLTLPNKFEKTW